VTCLYFEKGEDLAPSALREAFAAAKKEGQKAAQGATAEIAARREALQEAKAALDADLAAGKLTETDYANKLIALA
jgi:ketopantoate reductase